MWIIKEFIWPHLSQYTYRNLNLSSGSRVTHICVSNLVLIGSGHGLPAQLLGTNFSEIVIKIYTFSFTKKVLKMSLGNCRPFCLGLNVLMMLSKFVFNIKAPRHWPLSGEVTGTGEFSPQRASDAENVSIWWRHHMRKWTWTNDDNKHKVHSINSSPPSAAFMSQWIGSALVQIIACRLFGAKPLSKPIQGYCQLDL